MEFGSLPPALVLAVDRACDDFEAYIGRSKLGGTLRIQANGKQLVEQTDAESLAKWESAFNELLTGAYIRQVSLAGAALS